MLHHPCVLGDSQIKEDKIRIGPQVGGNAPSPLHSRGFPNKRGHNQNWPTSGWKCYITPAFSGIPKYEKDKIRIGPPVGVNATSPLRSRGSPNKGGQNQNWPTSGRKCYITPAFLGIPKQRGTKSEWGHKWTEMLHHPCVLGDPQIKEDKIRIGPQVGGNTTSPLHSRGFPNKGGQKSKLAHKWAEMLHHPCILGDSQTNAITIRIGPQVGGNATSPLPDWGSPNKGEQKGVAHKRAVMLHHPCILGDSQTNGERIRIGPQVGGNATSPLHSRGSPNKGG